MNRPGHVILLALIGIASTAAAYAAAIAAHPLVGNLVIKQLLADPGSLIWYGYYEGSLVFLCCLFGGLVQAAILTISRTARPDIAVATVVGSFGAWALQAYAVAFKGVNGYPFSGHFALIGPFHSATAGEFLAFVAGGFLLVGFCQALTMRRSAALAVFWPAVWLIGGLAFALAISLWSPVLPSTGQTLVFIGSGALLGLLASVWTLVPLGVRLSLPVALAAPVKAGAGAVLLVGLILGGGYWGSLILFGPIDDPRYFCGAPDPSPAPGISASTILQECAAGKTIEVKHGQTVAIDFQGGHGVDTSNQWVDFNVSDSSVLSTVTAPATVPGQFGRADQVAVYRAERSGQAVISGVEMFCTANGGGGCDRGHRWSVTIQVN